MTRQEVAAHLDLTYRRCGVNADWIDDAWHITPSGQANTRSGDFYILSNEEENDAWQIVIRTYAADRPDLCQDGNDLIEVVADFAAADHAGLIAWLENPESKAYYQNVEPLQWKIQTVTPAGWRDLQDDKTGKVASFLSRESGEIQAQQTPDWARNEARVVLTATPTAKLDNPTEHLTWMFGLDNPSSKRAGKGR